MSQKRDYYAVLGVSRTADDEQIKKAFRKSALKYHPDRNREEDAAERFKEVNEAYQVLSDPDARKRYDRYGHAGMNGSNGRGFEGFADFGGFGDIFESFFGGASATRPARGSDIEVVIDVSFRDAVFGTTYETDVRRQETCARCDGTRSEPGSKSSRCSTCDGEGQVSRVQRTVFGSFQQIATCSTCQGIGEVIRDACTECLGSGVLDAMRKIAINIPQGIDDGYRIVMRGQGDVGKYGGNKGDLYVRIRVEPDPVFTRYGNNIYIRTELNIVSAILGGSIVVPTLEGEREVEIPAGVQTGERISISGLGVPALRGNGIRGDQIVQIAVVTPRHLTPEQEGMVRQLGDSWLADDENALDPVIVRDNEIPQDRKESNSGLWGWLKEAFIGT